MQGKYPTKETDFMRLCLPRQLYIRDMFDLFEEDYPEYIKDYAIYNAVHRFLLRSNIYYKSYLKVRELFDDALLLRKDHAQVLREIKELSFAVIGRDIYKNEIEIIDGHNSSSYFWIMPVHIVDDSDTDDTECVAELRSIEISIEESDVSCYLAPFLYKYFDEELEANRKRADADGFEWYLTYNFFMHESVTGILHDIRDTIDALSAGRETEYTKELKIGRGPVSQEQIGVDDAAQPREDDGEVSLVIDFYQRFLYRMEYMMKVGKEKGYELISFMGP